MSLKAEAIGLALQMPKGIAQGFSADHRTPAFPSIGQQHQREEQHKTQHRSGERELIRWQAKQRQR